MARIACSVAFALAAVASATAQTPTTVEPDSDGALVASGEGTLAHTLPTERCVPAETHDRVDAQVREWLATHGSIHSTPSLGP